jgi:hypothetical protein
MWKASYEIQDNDRIEERFFHKFLKFKVILSEVSQKDITQGPANEVQLSLFQIRIDGQ